MMAAGERRKVPAATILAARLQLACLSPSCLHYCEFAFKPGVDFARINFDLFLQASDRRRYIKGIS